MTYTVSTCPACSSTDLDSRPAIVAPFIAAYVFHLPAQTCRVMGCKSCGLAFFEDRYEAHEAAALYDGYRGKAYFTARNRWEPWYTQAFNDDVGGDIAARRAVYLQTLADHRISPDSVLDFGGDRGQLISGGPGRALHVFDISGVEPQPDVVSIADAVALEGRTFDVVLLCEVLEHLPDPFAVLADAVRAVAPGGLLYVTVPNREFPLADIPAGRWYGRYLRTILKSRVLMLAADFWSSGVRVKFGRIPPLGFVKMHEHINFFDTGSLAGMLGRAGLSVLSCTSYGGGHGVVALCRKPA